MNVQVHRVSRNWHNPRRRDLYEATCHCGWFEVSVSEADARERWHRHAQSHRDEEER